MSVQEKSKPPLLSITDLWAGYPGMGAPVLKGLNLEVLSGEVIGILGENGTGKSSIGKVPLNLIQVDRGTWNCFGDFEMVPQHPTAFPGISVSELLTLKGGNPAEALRMIPGISKHSLLPELTMSQLHQVYFAASVSRILHGAGVLFLDESTAALSPSEIDSHYQMIEEFTSRGGGVILVGHRIEELRSHCNRIVIMQDGRVAYEYNQLSKITSQELTSKMFTHHLPGSPRSNPPNTATPYTEQRRQFSSTPAAAGTPESPGLTESVALKGSVAKPGSANQTAQGQNEPIFELESIQVHPRSDTETGLEQISFCLYPGEILAILGMKDQGVELLEEVLSGLTRVNSGQMRFPRGTISDLPGWLPSRGFGFIPHDRLTRGIISGMTVFENRILHKREKLGLLNWLNPNRYLKKHPEVRFPGDQQQPAGTLSGGMIQRLLIQRESDAAELGFMLSEPSWGLDPRYKQDLYQQLQESAAQGKGVLLLTSDIDEVLALAHRVLIMYQGRISREFIHQNLTRTQGIETMMGLTHEN